MIFNNESNRLQQIQHFESPKAEISVDYANAPKQFEGSTSSYIHDYSFTQQYMRGVCKW